MTVPGIDTLSWSSAAYSRRVARPSAGAALLPDPELAAMQEWPLRSYLELRALPASAHSARLHAKDVLCEWRLGALADTVELLVSEIITNAVRASADTGPPRPEIVHARAPWMRFWLTSDGNAVLIQVWDGDRHLPVRQDAGPDAETGRGLLLVDALSARWGCYAPDRAAAGKIVWAVCAG